MARPMRRRLPPALHNRDFALFTGAIFASSLAQQMVMVAIGWQVYAIHRKPIDLALIGLAEFVPIPLLALPAGQLADRLPRTLITAASFVGSGVVTALLLVVSIGGAHQLWPFLALAAGTGLTTAAGAPGRAGARPATRARRRARKRTRAALGRLADRGRQRPGARRPALRRELRGRVRSRHGPVRAVVPRRGADAALEDPGGAGRRPRARATQRPARNPLHPRHEDPARRDHARPVRRAVRRLGRTPAPLRTLDPAHGADRPGGAAKRDRGRRTDRGDPADAQAHRRHRQAGSSCWSWARSASAWSSSACRAGSRSRSPRSR